MDGWPYCSTPIVPCVKCHDWLSSFTVYAISENSPQPPPSCPFDAHLVIGPRRHCLGPAPSSGFLGYCYRGYAFFNRSCLPRHVAQPPRRPLHPRCICVCCFWGRNINALLPSLIPTWILHHPTFFVCRGLTLSLVRHGPSQSSWPTGPRNVNSRRCRCSIVDRGLSLVLNCHFGTTNATNYVLDDGKPSEPFLA